MLIIPAIDLKDGRVVRLFQGKYDSETVYSESPGEIARSFQDAGARLIHVVDLDGAKAGFPKNLSLTERITESVTVPVEMGGGVRSRQTADEVLRRGVFRVVVGTRAIEEGFVRDLVERFGPGVAVGIDVAGDKVCVAGWTEKSEANVDELLKKLKAAGLKTIIYTDVRRDGTLSGPNFSGIKEVLALTDMEVIASGGVSSLKDLKELKKLEKQGLAGVIVGKALYEKRFSLKEAIAEFQE